MRIYLVLIDETDEARHALRFASSRAAKTDGWVHIIALVPRQEFSPFGGVMATIEEEARQRAEVLAASMAGSVAHESGRMPTISVRQGEGAEVIKAYLAEHPEVSALVLGAAANGNPGPVVSHFTGPFLGQLPCPLMIVPGGLPEDRLIELS